MENDDDDVFVMVQEEPKQIKKINEWEIDGDRLISLVMSAVSFSFRFMSIVIFATWLIQLFPSLILPLKSGCLLVLAKFMDHTRNELVKESQLERKRIAMGEDHQEDNNP